MKGYTIGDNTNKDRASYPWRLDDEKLALPGLREDGEGGRGQRLHPQGPVRAVGRPAVPATCAPTATCATWARRRRTGRSSTSSSITRPIASPAAAARRRLAQFEQTGRIEWVTDLAEIPGKYGVTNVYADLGQLFAQTTVAEPRLTAAHDGPARAGLGADHVIWGTDAMWTGSPQWQIEGAAPARDPRGHAEEVRLHAARARPTARSRPRSSARTTRGSTVRPARGAGGTDRLAELKAEYERRGLGRSNRRYGYVVRG